MYFHAKVTKIPTVFFFFSTKFGSIQVAEWSVFLIADHEVLGSNVTGEELSSRLYGALLHKAFHYHPSIV